MKKFLALLLSLSMVLALSACGGTKSDDTTKADETKTDAPAETATDFRSATTRLLSWPMTAATSSSPTPSVTKTT